MKKGQKMTIRQKENVSNGHIGQIPWNKDKSMPYIPHKPRLNISKEELEKRKVYAKRHYWKNKEEINERRRKNPRSLYHAIKRNARYRNLSFDLTIEEFVEWWNSQKQECYYCEIPIERLKIIDRKKKMLKRLSIDRLDNKKGYEKGNLVLACMRCNFIKSNLLTDEEMKEIAQKYFKPKWQNL